MPILSYIEKTKLEQYKKEQQNLLFNACERGDLEEVKKIVENNRRTNEDWSGDALKIRADVKWLIDAQCDTCWTPIMFAARYGHLSIVEYLAQQGAILEHSSTYNPLHAACFGQSKETVQYLIYKCKCDVNPQTQEKTPLYIAITQLTI